MSNVKTFVNKPVQIEAIQFVDNAHTLADISEWSNENITVDYSTSPVVIEIHTPEGTMTANEGDWIIKGIKGEFYPCKPDIFESTYGNAVNEGRMFGEVVKNGLSYGEAMHEVIVNNRAVAREQWGGFWYNDLPGDPQLDLFTVPVLVAVLKDGKGIVPANPYNEDIQARDWMIVQNLKFPEVF